MNCSVVVFIGVYVNAYLFYVFIHLFSCIPDSYLHEETREGGAGSNARLITNENVRQKYLHNLLHPLQCDLRLITKRNR